MKNMKSNVVSFAIAKLQAKMRSILAIALVTVIGFSLIACGGGGGNDNPVTPPIVPPPELTGTVSITGTAKVGETLTADITGLGGTGTVTYSWERGTTRILGAQSSTYSVVEADIGSTITVTVARVGYTGGKTSAPTATVVAADLPELTGTVTITGTAVAGKTLTANTFSLTGSGDLTYQWKRGDTAIGTDSSTYVVAEADIGSTITVTVTREGYTGSKTSDPTAAVIRPFWTMVTNSPFGASDIIYGVAWGNDKFVAVGAYGKMAYSADGKTWTAVTNSTFDTSIIYDVAYGNSKFIAVGSNGKIAYSSNGETWTAVTGVFDSYTTINGIASNFYNYVAVGNGGEMAYSSNGETWTTVTSTFGSNNINSVTCTLLGGNTWIAVGANGKMASGGGSSPTIWTAVTNSTFGTTAINDVAYGGNNFVAVGNSGKIAYSTDRGETWTAVTDSTFGTTAIRSVAWNGGVKGYGGLFVAVGDSGKTAYSADGITWTAVDDSFEYSDICDVAFKDKTTGVAVGFSGKIAYNISE